MSQQIKSRRIRKVNNEISAFTLPTQLRKQFNRGSIISNLAYQQLFSLLHKHSTNAPEIHYHVGPIPNKFVIKAPKTETEKEDFKTIMRLLKLFNHSLDVIKTDKGEKFYFIMLD